MQGSLQAYVSHDFNVLIKGRQGDFCSRALIGLNCPLTCHAPLPLTSSCRLLMCVIVLLVFSATPGPRTRPAHGLHCEIKRWACSVTCGEGSRKVYEICGNGTGTVTRRFLHDEQCILRAPCRRAGSSKSADPCTVLFAARRPLLE